jgi:acetolactate synthase small subunit
MVMAAAEPSVLSRVIGLFAQRDLIPHRLDCRRIDGPEPALQIEVSVAGLDRQHAEHLALRMRNIMPVTGVLLDWD